MRYLRILNPWICPHLGEDSTGRETGDGAQIWDLSGGREDTILVPFEVVRSARRTMALQVKADGTVEIRLPRRTPEAEARAFAARHEEWLRKTVRRMEIRAAHTPQYGAEEIRTYKERLRPVLLCRVEEYAKRMGVSYGRIAIRDQKTRWGSCSAKGNLNFNWRLALVEPELLDYVVVHELAHRREMNHSPRFWALVEEILPDYRERRKKLKKILI